MALFGSGTSTKYWRTPAGRLFVNGATRPLWVSCWTKAANVTNGNQGLGHFMSTTTSAEMGTYIDASAAAWSWDETNAATFQQAGLLGAASANVWQHYVSYYPTASSRWIYRDGASYPTSSAIQDTGTVSGAQTFDSFSVGRITTAAAGADRLIAEVVFGSGPLPASMLDLLHSGANPLTIVPPAQLLGYFPLRGDLSDLGPMRTGLGPVGGATAIFGEHPPMVAAAPLRRRIFSASTTNTVVSFARTRAASAGRAAASLSAGVSGRSQAKGSAVAAPSPSSAIGGSTSSLATGRALASPAASLAARTQADAAGRSSLAPTALLTARTEGTPAGRASTSLTAPSTAKSSGQARGMAAAGGVSQLSGSARTQGTSAGRAAASPSAALSSRTQAGGRASATAGGLSQLSALARTAGLAAGRAAPSLGAALAGRARGNGAVRASPSPSTAATARTQAGARGMSSAGGVSVLSAAGATRGRAVGRAAIAISASLSASTISRGALRSGLSAGTALTAVVRSRAFGYAINGDQNPVFFHAGRVATIRTDGRLAILPVDTRAVTVSGST